MCEEDPHDPQVILQVLPERERGEFFRQYHEAVDGAHEPVGYRRLQQVLHIWSLAVVATNQPGYYEELAAAKRGIARTVPAENAIPGWANRLAAARAQGH